MKTAIYYFSGTGNSLKVARDLADNLENVKLQSMTKVKKINLNYDCIGFVFPVYYGGLPLNVAKFLGKIKSRKYLFAVATYGLMPGAALSQAKEILGKNGSGLNAGFVVHMPENFITAFDALPEKNMNRLFLEEEKKVLLISGIVKNKEHMPLEKDNAIINFLSNLRYNAITKDIPSSDRNFWVTKKCDGCRTCEKVCQFRNIEMKDKKPSWKHRCEQCFACIQFCPKKAIQIGSGTEKKKRYTNPHVRVTDINKK